MRLLLVVAATVHLSVASFCGDSAIPYSFEALSDGQPVLGCARPTCFGWNNDGLPASTSANFYNINKRPDGFLRKDRASIPPFKSGDTRYYKEHTAECEETYQSHNCPDENQWVAGIAPLLNVSAFPSVLQCCTFEPLRLSSDRGIATVNAGQIVVGGEVLKKGRQYAFDYISDVSKIVGDDGSISYEISIRRFPCLSLPTKRPTNFLYGAPKSDAKQRAFQAPTFEGGALPLPDNGPEPTITQPETTNTFPQTTNTGGQQLQAPPGNEENVIVEEIQAQDGVVPQPPQPPQPFQPPVQQQAPFIPPQEPVFQPRAESANSGGGSYAQGLPQPEQQPLQQTAYAQPPPNSYVQPAAGYAIAPIQPAPQPAPQPVYYPPAAAPAYYGGGGSGGGGGAYYCFTKDTKLTMIDGSEKRMDELQVEDWVQSTNETHVIYAPVTFWLHKMASQKAEFKKLELADGSILKLTGKHYIFKTSCDDNNEVEVEDISLEAVFADLVEEGDCLYRVQPDETVIKTRVEKVSTVEEVGIYAPMTHNGKLVVNGVVASCHNIIQSHTLQNSFFSYVDHFNNLYARVFGESSETRELPMGVDVILAMMEYIVPKNIVTM